MIALVVGKVAGVASQGATKSYLNSNSGNNEREIYTLLSKEIEKQRASLPRMLDSNTRLDDIQMNGRIMTSDHTMVTFSAAEIDKQRLVNMVIENNQKVLCNIARDAFDLGFSYNYRYFGKFGNYVTSVSTGKKECTQY